MSAKKQSSPRISRPPRERLASGTHKKVYRRSITPTPSSSDFPAPPLPDGTHATRFTLGGEELAVLSIPIGSNALPAELTPAERDVIELVFEGLTNGEIAQSRGTSLRTVANQVQAIFKKLGVSSRSELIARLAK